MFLPVLKSLGDGNGWGVGEANLTRWKNPCELSIFLTLTNSRVGKGGSQICSVFEEFLKIILAVCIGLYPFKFKKTYCSKLKLVHPPKVTPPSYLFIVC
jgi:hypothetical protein